MNSKLAKHLYFTLQRLRGEPVKGAFEDMMKSTFYDIHRLQSLQQTRMLHLIKYAMDNVPFYKESYARLENKINTIHTWNEFNDFITELPLLTKADFNSNRKLFFSEKIAQIKTTQNVTSGSSGDPISFDCDNISWAYRHAAVYRIMSLYGVNIGEPYGYFFGRHWKSKLMAKSFLKDFIFNRIRISAFSINEETVRMGLTQMKKLNVNHWLGYPSAIYEFCSLAKSLNYEIQPLKAVFTTAEPLYLYQRLLIEEVTKCKCVNIYGSVEGGIGAFEGVEGGFHQSMENSHLWVSPSNEIFATDLFLYANPLIKYEISDLVESTITRKTNLAHEQIGFIIGRSGAPIELSNGTRMNANLPSYIMKPYAVDGKIRKYRFRYFPREKKIILSLVLNSDLDHNTLVSLKGDCVRSFGVEYKLSIEILNSLPVLPNAKHRDFVTILN